MEEELAEEIEAASMLKKVWFTSDSYFCHANIIKYCSRPYADTAPTVYLDFTKTYSR